MRLAARGPAGGQRRSVRHRPPRPPSGSAAASESAAQRNRRPDAPTTTGGRSRPWRLRRPLGSRINPSTRGFGKYPSRDAAGLNALGAYRPVIEAANDRPTASLRREPAPPVHRPNFSLVAPRNSLNQAAALFQGHRAQRQHAQGALPVADNSAARPTSVPAAPLMAKRRLAPAPSNCRIVAKAVARLGWAARRMRSSAPTRGARAHGRASRLTDWV